MCAADVGLLTTKTPDAVAPAREVLTQQLLELEAQFGPMYLTGRQLTLVDIAAFSILCRLPNVQAYKAFKLPENVPKIMQWCVTACLCLPACCLLARSVFRSPLQLCLLCQAVGRGQSRECQGGYASCRRNGECPDRFPSQAHHSLACACTSHAGPRRRTKRSSRAEFVACPDARGPSRRCNFVWYACVGWPMRLPRRCRS